MFRSLGTRLPTYSGRLQQFIGYVQVVSYRLPTCSGRVEQFTDFLGQEQFLTCSGRGREPVLPDDSRLDHIIQMIF